MRIRYWSSDVCSSDLLGYLVQRPESHSVHHQRGVHAYNYSDLPLFDIVFGTFRNPRDFAHEQGFWQGASARVPQLLAFRDIARQCAGDRLLLVPVADLSGAADDRKCGV